MPKVTIVDHEKGIKKVYVGVRLVGCALKTEDGYFAFKMFSHGRGVLPSHALRSIADAIDELNAEWDKEVCKDQGLNT